ncbi:hypothetical protein [Nocardioides sp. Root190]|nr:hypothetical protein [Nocardioides sp. Root190]
MFEMLSEQRVRQDVDDRIRRASRRRLVARVKAARPGRRPTDHL